MRIAFVVPMRDRYRMAYAEGEDFIAHLEHADREQILENWVCDLAPIDEQIACADEIAACFETDMFQVQSGPVGAEFCSDAMLEQIASVAQAKNRRVYVYLQETKYQRARADAAYSQGIVAQLDRNCLLSPRLTMADGGWLRATERELLAQRGVIVSINTSSNLRPHSGIASVASLIGAGVQIAIGSDAASIDDYEDGRSEMHLTKLLHAGTGFNDVLSPAAIFEAAMPVRPRAVTARDEFGVIRASPQNLSSPMMTPWWPI